MSTKRALLEIGFTGTQLGWTPMQQTQVVSAIKSGKPDKVHQGMCIGSDTDFNNMMMRYFPDVIRVGHPPINQSKIGVMNNEVHELREPKPYLVRNHEIVVDSHVLIACPKDYEEVQRSGTWATIRYARKNGLMVLIIFPDGEYQYWSGAELLWCTRTEGLKILCWNVSSGRSEDCLQKC